MINAHLGKGLRLSAVEVRERLRRSTLEEILTKDLRVPYREKE